MKILHVLHGYPPNIGGTQLLFQQVSQRLVQTYGDEVTVFTTNAYSNYHFWQEDDRTMPTGTTTVDDVTVRRFPVFNRFSWLRLNLARIAYKFRLPYHDWARALYNGPLIPGLTQAIARQDADVVAAAAFPLLHMQAALWGGRRSNKPVIFYGGLHPADAWGFDRRMIYQAIAQADGYLANTSFERDYLRARGINGRKITITGAGVDVETLAQADGPAWRARYRCEDVPLIAFVGQQAEHKGIDTLLQAMPVVWQTMPAARLVIAGRPTAYSARLHRLISAFSPAQQKQVIVLDGPDDETKNNLLAACDVLAFPSRFPSRHESFGIVLAEAWACGKPVIGADMGAVAALIEAGRDGLLAPVEDAQAWAQALVTLLQDPDLRQTMGATGRQKVQEHFTWDAVVARFRQAYTAAVEARERVED